VVTDQRMSFVPSALVDLSSLQELSDVRTAVSAGDRVVVTGTDNVAAAVIIALHERGIQATRLRVDQPSLDDAFVALTHHDDRTESMDSRDGPPADPAATDSETKTGAQR
jgi:ABC-2 type transport system ATP-binding protein